MKKTAPAKAPPMKTLPFALVCFAVLLVCLFSPLWRAAAAPEAIFSDLASHNLMGADLDYIRAYGLDSPIPRYYTHGDVTEGGVVLANSQMVLEHILGGAGMPAESYHYYTSNLCVQRYFFALVGLLPLPMPALLAVLEGAAVVLMAAVLAGLVAWVRSWSRTGVAVVVLVVLGLFSPTLNSLARNLYFLPYTWFVPMLGAAWAAHRWRRGQAGGDFSGKRWGLLAFLMAFGTCLFKQLHCFEYVSSVMVAMMVPYVMALAAEVPLKNWRVWLKTLLPPALGALLSFAAAVGLNLWALLAFPYVSNFLSGQSAFSEFLLTVLRSTGGAEKEAQLLAEGQPTGLLDVLRQMLGKPFLSVRGVLSVSFYALVGLLALATVYLLWRRARGGPAGPALRAWFVGAWAALLGPLSWFVLARLHAAGHSLLDSAVWYLPFVPVACGALAHLAGLCFRGLPGGRQP